MKFNAMGLMLCTFLIGCGSGDAPFGQAVEEPVEEAPADDGTPIDSDRVIPPGTASPQPDTSIFRSEPLSADTGNGFAQGVRYNAEDDTLFVDNLPFDGGEETPYIRGRAVSSFGEYAVYEAVDQFPDAVVLEQLEQAAAAAGETVDGDRAAINQLTHRAIYGVGRDTGQTEFAIIRTGSYVQYGFGGFVYQRNAEVDLPTEGQGLYLGQGAGLRDYNSRGGLEYSTSDVEFNIDFDDFNAASGRYEGAVRGQIDNRRVFDLAGNEITSTITSRVGEANSAELNELPEIRFIIEPNVLDANGELTGSVFSTFDNLQGEAVTYEEGNYYGILAGENGGELVGVIVVESSIDPSSPDGARDTIGFQLYREGRPVE